MCVRKSRPWQISSSPATHSTPTLPPPVSPKHSGKLWDAEVSQNLTLKEKNVEGHGKVALGLGKLENMQELEAAG